MRGEKCNTNDHCHPLSIRVSDLKRALFPTTTTTTTTTETTTSDTSTTTTNSVMTLEPNHVFRILFRTRTVPQSLTEDWTNDFAHFEPECAQWLTETFPNLLLIGIDTPSIDHPSASPIIECSHGMLWRHRVAILENLNLNQLFVTDNEEQQRVKYGQLQTIWNPMQEFKDARGCFVRFYPAHHTEKKN